jgi:hypothetical protein
VLDEPVDGIAMEFHPASEAALVCWRQIDLVCR